MVGLVVDSVRLKNTLLTRVSRAPERSRASIVLANVGAFLSLAIVRTSSRCSRMPSTRAGR